MLITISVIILASLIGFGIYQAYSYHKLQNKREAYFDHFMNYWYSFYEQYNEDVEIYTRMKKSIILDYIRTGKGRYIDEQVPLYGGGTFSMSQHFNIDRLLNGWWIAHKAIGPIKLAPESRKEEWWAFWQIYCSGRQLSQIDEYDENLALDINYLQFTFNQIDSLSNEIHKGFITLERYKNSLVSTKKS